MYRVCIVVADASRARLFRYDRTSDGGERHDKLEELTDLVNPARRLRPVQLFSDSRPGSSRAGGLQFGFDDHRDAHIDELDAEFARQIAAAIDEQLATYPTRRLILCASPRMLGKLRAIRETWAALAVDEVPRDLVKLTPAELLARLDGYRLLPPRAPTA